MKLINFITNNATKLPPLGAVGCVHLVSSRSCVRQHESCIAYRQCWILLFGLIQMRPSASTLIYLHCTATLDLITNYLRLHPSQSVGRRRSSASFGQFVRSSVSRKVVGRSSSAALFGFTLRLLVRYTTKRYKLIVPVSENCQYNKRLEDVHVSWCCGVDKVRLERKAEVSEVGSVFILAQGHSESQNSITHLASRLARSVAVSMAQIC
jgi:hypothetical protein